VTTEAWASNAAVPRTAGNGNIAASLNIPNNKWAIRP